VENPSSNAKSTDGKLTQAVKDRVMKEVSTFFFLFGI
jgi:hypothetical protein